MQKPLLQSIDNFLNKAIVIWYVLWISNLLPKSLEVRLADPPVARLESCGEEMLCLKVMVAIYNKWLFKWWTICLIANHLGQIWDYSTEYIFIYQCLNKWFWWKQIVFWSFTFVFSHYLPEYHSCLIRTVKLKVKLYPHAVFMPVVEVSTNFPTTLSWKAHPQKVECYWLQIYLIFIESCYWDQKKKL